jgi:hypothetical protein
MHPEIERIAAGIEALHQRWTPHHAQIAIGRPLLRGETKDVFAQCGRNFGKTELVSYLLWRFAWTYSNSENYYFAPYMTQAREILWASRRVQTFGPTEWIEGQPNNTEMRITFKNGSFIKLAGSDNVDSYRGVKPKGLTVLDEFKDFRPEFLEAYDPNRAAFDSPMMIIGTPPEFENQFTNLAKIYESDPNKRFFQMPTSVNPHINREWLEKKKAELYALGEGDKWEREYEAKFVTGGASAIFPMLSRKSMITHDQMIGRLWKDRKKLEWILWADPAGASCFAVLFVAINPYTKEIFCLDEIYETTQVEMTVSKIWRRIKDIRDDLNEECEWRQGYDEASTWFANEVFDLFNEGLEPTQKMRSDKLTGLSMIKDALLQGKLILSDRCQKLYWELERYRKDASGKIPKKDDHLIDCLRYIMDSGNYSVKQEREMIKEADEMKRGTRIEDDFPDLFNSDFDLE